MSSDLNISEIANRVIQKMNELEINDNTFEIETSGRHIHLSRKHIDMLFGKDYELTIKRYLSQPGQYACEERLTLIGPKGVLHNVIILGPERAETQVEVSLTDARTLGINVPVRMSGDTEGSPGIILINGSNVVSLNKGLIVAKRHVHVNDQDAPKLGVEQGDTVKVKVLGGDRNLIFDDVAIRVDENYATSMHIDYDEGNACGHKKGIRGIIFKD
jgi:propanediol utilization protein